MCNYLLPNYKVEGIFFFLIPFLFSTPENIIFSVIIKVIKRDSISPCSSATHFIMNKPVAATDKLKRHIDGGKGRACWIDF